MCLSNIGAYVVFGTDIKLTFYEAMFALCFPDSEGCTMDALIVKQNRMAQALPWVVLG